MSKTTVVNVRGRSQAELEALGVVYVGRRMPRDRRPLIKAGSPWGNPFQGGEPIATLYRYLAHVAASPDLLAALPALRGRPLGCWCCDWAGGGLDDLANVGAACHALVLALLADGRIDLHGDRIGP